MTRLNRWARLAAAPLVVAAGVAHADGSGTIDDASLAVTYSAGPFYAPNPFPFGAGLPEVGPFCDLGSPTCETYTLTLNLSDAIRLDPANEFATLDISVTFANPQADFDPFVYDPAGERIAGPGGGQGAPEYISLPIDATLANGAYTIRVVPWLPMGDSFTLEVKVVGLGEAASKSGVLGVGSIGSMLLPLLGLAALRRRLSIR